MCDVHSQTEQNDFKHVEILSTSDFTEARTVRNSCHIKRRKKKPSSSCKESQRSLSYFDSSMLDPSTQVFFSSRSAAYLRQRNGVAALADGETCVRIKPDWAEGYCCKGAALQFLNRFDDAADAYVEGVKI